MKYLVSSCAVSETSKPRPLFDAQALFIRNECFLAPETLIEVQRGIQRLAGRNPKRAAELREWYSAVSSGWKLAEGFAREKAKLIASMLECRPLKTIWLPQPKASNPSFGYHINLAATAIIHELPLAVASADKFMFIDRYFQLPGMHDLRNDVWLSSSTQSDGRAAQ